MLTSGSAASLKGEEGNELEIDDAGDGGGTLLSVLLPVTFSWRN